MKPGKITYLSYPIFTTAEMKKLLYNNLNISSTSLDISCDGKLASEVVFPYLFSKNNCNFTYHKIKSLRMGNQVVLSQMAKEWPLVAGMAMSLFIMR